jgi:hypothetical protein
VPPFLTVALAVHQQALGWTRKLWSQAADREPRRAVLRPAPRRYSADGPSLPATTDGRAPRFDAIADEHGFPAPPNGGRMRVLIVAPRPGRYRAIDQAGTGACQLSRLIRAPLPHRHIRRTIPPARSRTDVLGCQFDNCLSSKSTCIVGDLAAAEVDQAAGRMHQLHFPAPNDHARLCIKMCRQNALNSATCARVRSPRSEFAQE